MSTFTITAVERYPEGWTVSYVDDETGTGYSHSIPPLNRETLMAEYGLDDLAEAVDILLHDPHAWAWIGTLDPRDDPAVAEGWVTTDQPDAEAVTLFNARSTFDARGAHRARMQAVKETGTAVINDPGGLLQQMLDPPIDTDRINAHAEHVDIFRWTLVYGGLPTPQAQPVPVDQEG